MRNLLKAILGALGLLTMSVGAASAQGMYPPARPAVSPYLNLLRAGTPPGLNYYNLVRPQIEFTSSINMLNQQVGANRLGLTSLEQSMTQGPVRLPATGFVPQFMNQRQYFMTYSGVNGGSIQAARPAQAPAPRRR